MPTTVASWTFPSEVRTAIFGLLVVPPRVTTCVLVRMCPALSRMTPEPEPASELPATSMVTTLGLALAAAAVTAVTFFGLLMTTSPCGVVLEETVAAGLASIT